ncbi:efflux RND transporter periplasmic adaptor subunit [Acetonema longum]|uniref:efflux RND transporter periplasmic adaptor subunit n=1 Tax=Acetonema longum TaxID=2374 RepID=UPI001EE68A32|nr:HlyD family efflux transporter periplasmic adaptor subunit [Acetonema longum]
MLQHKKWLLLLVVLAIAVRADMLQAEDQKQPAHRILVVKRGNIATVVAAKGIVVPVNTVNTPMAPGSGENSAPVVLLDAARIKMQIEAQISEFDIDKILVGQKVKFTADACPDQIYSGNVASISRKGHWRQHHIYYPVIIDMDEGKGSEGVLRPEMTARISIWVGERLNVLAVPLKAVKESRNQRYVQVLKDGQPHNITVTTGLANDASIEIIEGLQEGDRLILPQAKVRGQKKISGFIRQFFGSPGIE